MSAVITGLGVVAPTGIGADEHWRATLAGEPAVRSIEAFDAGRYATTLAGQVPGFSVEEYVPHRLAIQTDRWTWLAFAATQMALADADYDPDDHDPYATSVVLGTGSGGNEFGQREIQALWSRGSKAVGAYQSIAWFYAASTGQMSIRYGTKGPSGVLVSDAAGGVDGLGWAERVIRRGTPAVSAGGTEAPLSPYALTCQIAGGRLSSSTDPRTGYKPFDTAANGHVPGEGGAVLIVEDAAAAAARTAPAIYGLVAGYAASHDAHHYRDVAPDGRQYARAIRQALAQAGCVRTRSTWSWPTARDRSTRTRRRRARCARSSAGAACRSPPRRGWSAGCARAVRRSTSPPRCRRCAPESRRPSATSTIPIYGLDLVREPREMTIKTVVVGARGHGGFNSALVLRRVDRAGAVDVVTAGGGFLARLPLAGRGRPKSGASPGRPSRKEVESVGIVVSPSFSQVGTRVTRRGEPSYGPGGAVRPATSQVPNLTLRVVRWKPYVVRMIRCPSEYVEPPVSTARA